jgi:hypothetical protein
LFFGAHLAAALGSDVVLFLVYLQARRSPDDVTALLSKAVQETEGVLTSSSAPLEVWMVKSQR